MKKLSLSVFLILLVCNVANAREYCFVLNEKNQVFHKRPETIVTLMMLDQELICLGKINEAEIYKQEWKKVMNKTLDDGVPMYPKGSKNRFKICGQIHFNDKEENMDDIEKVKKYLECEKKRVEKIEQDAIDYLYQLFYKLEKQ